MGRAKEIIVKVIPSKIANEFVKQHHYSGKCVPNSSLHFGCFLDDKLHGVLSYGSPMDKRKVLQLVTNTGWNDMLELNRMAFDNYLPKYSESRCIAITIKLIKKNASHIKWILSFSDGTQCGDGTIYRASGFNLTSIKINQTLGVLNGKVVSDFTFQKGKHILNNNGKAAAPKEFKYLNGFQLRYIYLIDKTCKITVPILPFSKIDEMGAGMYKGKKVSLKERKNAAIAQGSALGFQSGDGVRSDLAAQIKQRNNNDAET
jgi:hypothetical protein